MKKPMLLKIIDSIINNEELELSDKEFEYKKRLLFIIQLKLDNISATDKDIYYFTNKEFGAISFPQIIADIGICERIIATKKDKGGDAQKIFSRYLITETLKESINIAREKNDAYGMAMAANLLGKHNLTDKDDVEKVDWNKVIPFIPIITSDTTVIGIEQIPTEKLNILKEKMNKKYGLNQELPELNSEKEIENVDFEETE